MQKNGESCTKKVKWRHCLEKSQYFSYRNPDKVYRQREMNGLPKGENIIGEDDFIIKKYL